MLLMRKFIKFVKSGKKNFYLKLLLFFEKKLYIYIIVRDPVACDDHSNRKNTFSLKVAIYVNTPKHFPEFSPSFSRVNPYFHKIPKVSLSLPKKHYFSLISRFFHVAGNPVWTTRKSKYPQSYLSNRKQFVSINGYD